MGHRTLIQVGASVILEDPQGRILLQLRSDNHCCGYCGGSIEVDDLRFFAVDEIPDRLSPPFRPPLEKWLEQKKA